MANQSNKTEERAEMPVDEENKGENPQMDGAEMTQAKERSSAAAAAMMEEIKELENELDQLKAQKDAENKVGVASGSADDNDKKEKLEQPDYSKDSAESTEAESGTPWYRKAWEKVMAVLPLKKTKGGSKELNQKLFDDDCDVVQSARESVSAAPLTYVAIAAGVLFLLGLGLFSLVHDKDLFVNWNRKLEVAFLGNAYLYMNDIPRVMEAISDGHIHQQSVIHATKGSLPALLMRGNGMYGTWNTENAYLDTVYNNGEGEGEAIYDLGLCTVGQILEGYDEILNYGNNDNAYYDDGLNPCIMDEAYYTYTTNMLYDVTYDWDYVVMADQTKRMASSDGREDSIYALTYAYAPMLAKGRAVPVIVDTHSFSSNGNDDQYGYGDVVEFQASIYEGVYEYVEALSDVLPRSQAPIIAPVGIAYLTVYEEHPETWEKLFVDGEHASVHGSYLFACVLYATMYGHLPQEHNDEVEAIFASSRQLSEGNGISYPEASDAAYYRNVARRVALRGYVPRDMRSKLQAARKSAAQATAQRKQDAEDYAAAQYQAQQQRDQHDEEHGEEHNEEEHGGEDNGPE